MDFANVDTIVTTIILFIPGYISLKTYSFLLPFEKIDVTKSILEIVFYTFINYLIFIYPLILIFSGDFYINYRFLFFLFIFLIQFVSPVLLTYLWVKIIKSKKFSEKFSSPYYSSWDYFINKKEGAWVLIKLEDGRYIGGLFSTDSCASTYPNERDIYLEKVYDLNQDLSFGNEIPNTKGAYIHSKNIQVIQFFN